MTDGARVSYAQNGEDVRVWRALRDVDDVFYVEVGASDPLEDSTTAALSAEGARGLLVEADPDFAARLRDARPRDVVVAAAASDKPGVLTWNDLGARGRGAVSTTQREDAARAVTVPAVRVGDLLADLAPSAVHFMSVDVEGHEAAALAGADLGRWRPWILCVEATRPGSREQNWDQWHDVVVGAGLSFVTFDGLNRWYVSDEHPELATAVREPYNALDELVDGWQRREVVQLRSELAEARRALAEQSDRSSALEQQLAVAERAAQDAAASARQVQSLQHQLDLVVAQRDAAVARERVMLESKSWRLTSPLRKARSNADTARARRAARAPDAPAAPLPRRADTPADLRRRRALSAKLSAAARRRAER